MKYIFDQLIQILDLTLKSKIQDKKINLFSYQDYQLFLICGIYGYSNSSYVGFKMKRKNQTLNIFLENTMWLTYDPDKKFYTLSIPNSSKERKFSSLDIKEFYKIFKRNFKIYYRYYMKHSHFEKIKRELFNLKFDLI